MAVLVIGADGFIGKSLFQYLKSRGFDATGGCYSNRKTDSTDTFFLDLTDPVTYAPAIVAKNKYFVFCNNFGSVDFCKTNPIETRAVNVTAVKTFLERVKTCGGIPVYLSSNMVFSGDRPNYSEDDTVNPVTEYGRQKSEMESYIQNNFHRFIITRMTKVYGSNPNDNSLFSAWFMAWKNKQKISAIFDTYVAPLYLGDATTAITSLIATNQTGIFHLAGSESKSWFDFAAEFATFLKVKQNLIERVSIENLGLLEKRPLYNSLSTKKIESALTNFAFTKPADAFFHYVGARV